LEMICQNGKIGLRRFAREDIEAFAKGVRRSKDSKNELSGMLRKISSLYQQFEKDGFFSREKGKLLIVLDQGEIIGYCSYFKSSPYVNGYEIGYQIFQEDHRGKGYGTQAVRLFTDFLFELQPILRIQICMDEQNHASERVAEKAGFSYEGIMRSVFQNKERIVNNKVFSIIRKEWEAR